jgi:NTP pyrophosphatase (non-canonical NTP hydrolase)
MSAPMQPWAPTITDHQKRRAGKTLEELGELVAVLARLQIQAIDDIDLGSGKTNRQRLLEEIADVYAQLDLTFASFNLDFDALYDRISRKKELMFEWEAHFKSAAP